MANSMARRDQGEAGMKLRVLVTDPGWFRYLADHPPDGEVNFWRPSAQQGFAALEPGEPVLFKLKSPYNAIAGGGFFLRFLRLSVTMAWTWFGPANGFPSLLEMRRRLGNGDIGCLVVAEPFFWPESQWLPAPADFAPNIQQGKNYDMDSPAGHYLLDAVADRLRRQRPEGGTEQAALVETVRYGTPRLVAPRVGQSGFRVLVTEAYDRRCAVTGEKTLPALDAAHIVPYGEGGPHAVDNGLLLRSDLHRLFDRGYLTVDPDDLRLRVSPRIRHEFHNGHAYYALHGTPLRRPAAPHPGPNREYLAYHAQHVFLEA
jgi:putative restriction endonuclease